MNTDEYFHSNDETITPEYIGRVTANHLVAVQNDLKEFIKNSESLYQVRDLENAVELLEKVQQLLRDSVSHG
jgi:hypothetical protein